MAVADVAPELVNVQFPAAPLAHFAGGLVMFQFAGATKVIEVIAYAFVVGLVTVTLKSGVTV